MSNIESPNLKPPFEVEFPNDGTSFSERDERLIEQGIKTPRMALTGRFEPSRHEVQIALSAEEAKELSDTRKAAIDFAEQHGGHPDDYDPDYR